MHNDNECVTYVIEVDSDKYIKSIGSDDNTLPEINVTWDVNEALKLYGVDDAIDGLQKAIRMHDRFVTPWIQDFYLRKCELKMVAVYVPELVDLSAAVVAKIDADNTITDFINSH